MSDKYMSTFTLLVISTTGLKYHRFMLFHGTGKSEFYGSKLRCGPFDACLTQNNSSVLRKQVSP